jgi:hypothetical protein
VNKVEEVGENLGNLGKKLIPLGFFVVVMRSPNLNIFHTKKKKKKKKKGAQMCSRVM